MSANLLCAYASQISADIGNTGILFAVTGLLGLFLDFFQNGFIVIGVVMFLNNFTALEVNVGVLGIGYSETKSTTDQIYVSRRDSRSASLNLNLFSLSFGVAFYL